MDALSSISVSEVVMPSPSFNLLLATTLVPIISVADYGEGRGGLCGARKV